MGRHDKPNPLTPEEQAEEARLREKLEKKGVVQPKGKGQHKK